MVKSTYGDSKSIYGVVKTHKPNNPIRPIISTVGSCSYGLSKWLVNVLNPIIGTISDSHIKNNIDLKNKLQSLNCSYEFVMISFDVVSLFTRVPVSSLLDYFDSEFSDYPFPIPCSEVIELLKLCILDSKFVFNDNYYSQRFGMSMGNPLSPVLSNMYMEFFEKYLLSQILPAGVHWYRYVDDIFCLWPCNLNYDVFLDNLNSLVPSIKFTLEIENNNKLPFLDMMIYRCDNNFKFDVYRKPTNIMQFVHYYSSTSMPVKISVFHSMFLRALRICSDEFLSGELNIIAKTAESHKYPSHIIDKSLTKAYKTFTKIQPDVIINNNQPNKLFLPYHENFAHLPYIFSKFFNVRLTFSGSSNVKSLLISNAPKSDEGVVYTIPCKGCNIKYIGQTGKTLETRIKQHKYSIRTAQLSNALFVHRNDNNHPIDFDNSKIIIHIKDFTNRNIIESAIIQHHKNEICNLSLGLYNLDKFIINSIVNFINSAIL